ncbi:hypothetical protein CRBSH125_17550 [Afipia carboxidovorans]|nr:hypothetical protein CRBSH125_17550 [Afipia carboxidovorans]
MEGWIASLSLAMTVSVIARVLATKQSSAVVPAQALPLPVWERVGVRGSKCRGTHSIPLTRLAIARRRRADWLADLSPPGRGEGNAVAGSDRPKTKSARAEGADALGKAM